MPRIRGFINQLKWTKLEKTLKMSASATEEAQKNLAALKQFEHMHYRRRNKDFEERDVRDVAPAHK